MTRNWHRSRIENPVTGTIYERDECLGEGGFGIVFRARPVDRRGRPVGADVCIKFTEDQASWHREAYFGELLAGNSRAIRVMEAFPLMRGAGTSRAVQYCLVLELAQHGALADWLETRSHPWDEAKIKREVVALLRVLDQLHGGAALHRDLTPFNVFVCAGERLKLGDFGIAQHHLGGKGVAADVFNLAWAPSELADDRPHRWLATDDIYHIGQLLAVLVRHDASEPITTRAVRTLACSDALKMVIRRAIGPRDERYRDALEMIAAIEAPRDVPTGGVSTLRGKVVVFTGVLSMTRERATRLVRRAGGEVAKAVTGATDVLVRGWHSPIWIAGKQGVKLLAAARIRERGGKIRVINESQFRRLVRLSGRT